MPELAAVVAKVEALRRDLDGGALRSIITDVAVEAKADILAEARRDVGADLRMSGWRRIRFGAGFELLDDTTAEIGGRPPGPWGVLEFGRRAGRRHSRKRGRVVGWGPTQGKGTFNRATREISRDAPARIHRATVKAIARHFGV